MDEAELAPVLWRAFEDAVLGEETDMRREWDEIPAATKSGWLAVARTVIALRT